MWIKNVKVLTTENEFLPGEVWVCGERIGGVFLGDARKIDDEILDGGGGYLLPGMIDMHLHGCMGADFSDAAIGAIQTIAEYEASIGVTAIAPAAMTLPKEELLGILRTAASFRRRQSLMAATDAAAVISQAELVGIHMEGPFISPKKCGAQDAAHILARRSADFWDFQRAADGLVKLIAIAPEEPGEDVAEFIAAVGSSAAVSLAHTDADYDTAAKAFQAGASHTVHLFNAMPAFHHRSPGVVGAAADHPDVTAELICDGVHLHPAMIRAAFSLFGEERIIFISDSMRAAGLTDGDYLLGGQEVTVRGNEARLKKDGSLAGSVTTLPDCVRFAVVGAGIPLGTAVSCATLHPAKRLGIENDYGSITAGKYADLVIWDENYALRHVIRHGRLLAK